VLITSIIKAIFRNLITLLSDADSIWRPVRLKKNTVGKMRKHGLVVVAYFKVL